MTGTSSKSRREEQSAKAMEEMQRCTDWLVQFMQNSEPQIFKAQEVNMRMKHKAAHACRALCRARVLIR
jgi:hypothetical protein